MLRNKEHMNLAQSIFIILIINTKHGYSSETRCSWSNEKKLEKYSKTVEDLQYKMLGLKIFYDKNYSEIISKVFLPEYSQFNVTRDSIEVETLLHYKATLRDYRSALVSSGKNTQILPLKFNIELKVNIENIISKLDEIISLLKPSLKGKRYKSRFNKTEIDEKSVKHFEKTPDSKNLQVKTIYAIIIQFLKFLSNFIGLLCNFLRFSR